MTAPRELGFLLAEPEKRLLTALAAHVPRTIRSNHLTVLGTLGAILEASLKVLPRPDEEVTLRFQMDERCPKEIRIACPWYKPARNTTTLRPDYYLHETEDWLVFPHELVGLKAAEIAAGKSDLREILSGLHLG